MTNDKDIADFLAGVVPAGTVSSVHHYENGDVLFHPDIPALRNYLEEKFLADAENVLKYKIFEKDVKILEIKLDPSKESLHKRKAELEEIILDIKERIAFFKENSAAVLENLDNAVISHLSIPHIEPKFSGEVLPPSGKEITMVEPWDNIHSARDAAGLVKITGQQHRWVTAVKTLEHYGAQVNIVPAKDIGGGRDVWARDPAVIINGEAFVSSREQKEKPELNETPYKYLIKPETFLSYHEHLKKSGVQVTEVSAEIEGGNTLVDTKHGVILYAMNIGENAMNIGKMDTKQYVQGELERIFGEFEKVHTALSEADDTTSETVLELFGSSKEGKFAQAYNAVIGREAENIGDKLTQLHKSAPHDVMIDVEKEDKIEQVSAWTYLYGELVPQLKKIQQTHAEHMDQINTQADALEQATGLPVIPVPLVDKELYHLDTFAATLPDGTLMIYPDGTTPDAVERLEFFYGDKIVLLNDEDVQGLGANLVTVGDYVITNHLSAQTQNILSERGYEVITSESIGYDYGFVYDGHKQNYIGSGIHCLTDENFEVSTNKPSILTESQHVFDANTSNVIFPASMQKL